ncbi:MAG TPA: phospholipase D-like domain-containing protein [Anaeromyxobacteraceae bacterium]|nr:phospholipase D-like domain-containing protein [Anaeromyxobacteraceae bacterium]
MGEPIHLRDARGELLPGQWVALLDGGPEAFPRMLQAIHSAEQSIRLETYTFRREGVGEEFLAALSAAAQRGVRVEVVLDGWGSALDGRYVQGLLDAAGCEVRIYHPVLSLLVGRFRRLHRKVLVVDGEVAFVGGVNISDEYGHLGPGHAPEVEAQEPAWLDLVLEVGGPVAAWLGRRLRGERLRAPPGPVHVHLSGLGGGLPLRRRYLKALGAARRTVEMAHAYFLPDRRLVRSLTAAARRGVQVTLLLAGRSDVPLARAATRRLYHQLLRAGVHIHEWTRSVHHAKAAVVDDRRLLAGSFNLEPYSLANLELLVEVDDAAVARQGGAWIERRVAQAEEVTLAILARRSRVQRWLVDAAGLFVARLAQWVGRLLARR